MELLTLSGRSRMSKCLVVLSTISCKSPEDLEQSLIARSRPSSSSLHQSGTYCMAALALQWRMERLRSIIHPNSAGNTGLLTISCDEARRRSCSSSFCQTSTSATAPFALSSNLAGHLPNCTWDEVDFGDLRNGKWSGYDRSSIPNSAGNTGLLTISCKGAKTSSKGSNDFTSLVSSLFPTKEPRPVAKGRTASLRHGCAVVGVWQGEFGLPIPLDTVAGSALLGDVLLGPARYVELQPAEPFR